MATRREKKSVGELALHAAGFHAHLLGLGYSRSAANKHRQLVVHLSRWLEHEGIPVAKLLTRSAGDGFFENRRNRGTANLRTSRSLEPLIDYLARHGMLESVEPAPTGDPVEAFCDHYRRYLLEERGVVEGTARFYVHVARLLAQTRRSEQGVDWSLRAADVTSFAARTCGGRSLSSARQVVSALRSVLRYLAMEGLADVALDDAVLSVAGRSALLPRGISPAEVEMLVAACEGDGTLERRDRAIVLLLCRLGMRDGEVIALHLDDIDWRSGEVVVSGKGGRRDRLPLSEEVGGALADYLEVRPRVEDRRVFLRHIAPIRALAETGSVRAVLERACRRAGIAYVNPHRLRHTVATSMLRSGVSLRDIGQVLGHGATAVTATYARVDLVSLRGLATRWPEVRS